MTSTDHEIPALTDAGHEKIQTIIGAITAALSSHAAYFDITPSEILVDEEDIFSAMISFKPRPMEVECGRIEGEAQYLQFDIRNNDQPVLIIGEDTETEISAASLYADLYWGSVVKSDDEN